MQDEIAYKLLKLVEEDPHLSQREIAKQMGISLGKANYCIKSLIDKGYIKAKNFYKSDTKGAYMYILTPRGWDEKARVTYRFLRRKMDEYEEIQELIERLKSETEQLGNPDS